MPRKRRRDVKERPPGWPLHFYITLTTTADTWYDFVVYRRMRVWQFKQVLRLIIFEGEDYPLDTMAIVYGGVVLKSKKMLKEYRVTEAGYSMVLKGFERDWPVDEIIDDENLIDERDVEQFLKTAKPSDIGYLDMGPEPDKEAALEVPQEVIDFWTEQGVDMSEKNIIPAHDIRAIAEGVQRDTNYLPEPSKPPAEKVMGVEEPAIDAETLKIKLPEEPAEDEKELPPHLKKLPPIEEKEKTLMLPEDFEVQVDQLSQDVSSQRHPRKVIEEVFKSSEFNYGDTVSKLLQMRTVELQEEITEDAEHWKIAELTEKDHKEIRSLMDDCDDATIDQATKAYIDSGKKFQQALDFLNSLVF